MKSPVAFPTGAIVSAGGVWLTSIDRPFASASGPWVLSFSSDLVGWRECLRHASPRTLLRAFGGIVVRGWPEVTDARCSSDGQTWTELLLPTPEARLFEDGRDGLWALGGDQLWHRLAGSSAFEAIELEEQPDRIVACPAASFFGSDGRWWRVEGAAVEPVPTLKRVQVSQVVALDQRVLALADGALWHSADGGRTFERVAEVKHEAVVLGVFGQHFAVGCRGALLLSDGPSFSTTSENDQAEFSAIAPLGDGALVVDRRRARLFTVGNALAVSQPTPPAQKSAEFVEAEALLASMEAPLLAARTGTLDALRTQAERTEPRGGWQPHLVYLDALQDAGDPDAPILATLNRLQQGPRFDDYLTANFGQVVSRQDALTWRNGFIDSATLYGTQVRGLLERTSAFLLRRLHIWGHHDPFDLSAIGQTLRGLHVLHLDGFSWSDEDDLEHHDWGDLSLLWRALGQLRTLWITGAVERLGVIVLPSCEQLTLAFERAPADDLAALRVPSVRELRLAWNDSRTVEWLSTFLARSMASLNVVRLAGRNGDAVADVLVNSKVPVSCETLELSGVQLTDAGLERLGSVKWPRLRTLDLRWNRLSTAGIERARSFCSEVMLAEQAPTTEFNWPPNWLL